MSSQDKDFIDNFLDYFKPYQNSGVRFLAVIICYILFFIIGTALSPSIIRHCRDVLPFSVEFLQLSPWEVLFNYLKVGFFFSFFATLPVAIYQFGKLKIEKDMFKQRMNLLYTSIGVAGIILLTGFLTYKLFFPWQIMFLYGMNFDVAYFSASLSSMVSAFIFTIFVVLMLAFLPLLNFLIKKSLFFNYATFTQYRKPVVVYCVVLSLLIVLPLELFALGVVFLTFFFWYKLLVNFSKKRD